MRALFLTVNHKWKTLKKAEPVAYEGTVVGAAGAAAIGAAAATAGAAAAAVGGAPR